MPSLKKDDSGFTEMQRAFLRFYLDASNPPTRWNATASAKAAGYSPKTAHSIGHELLGKPHIKAEVDAYWERDEARRKPPGTT